jgi:hypothetical protein
MIKIKETFRLVESKNNRLNETVGSHRVNSLVHEIFGFVKDWLNADLTGEFPFTVEKNLEKVVQILEETAEEIENN